LLMGRIDRWGVDWNNSFLWLEPHWRQWILELCKIEEINLLTLGWQWQHRLKCKCHFWWIQCRFVDERNWMWLKEVHVITFVPRGNQNLTRCQQRCHKLHHEFLMCSLPWAQCNIWIPIGSMECVHMHQGIFAIEGWGNPNHV
jgi:hypothetical protein